jgi:hypothetical protein
MSIFDQIKADREAGSGRDWKWHARDPKTGFLSRQMRWLDVGAWLSFASAPAFTVASDDNAEENHSEAQANMSRIARVPQLERIALAAEAVANELEGLASNAAHAAKTDERWASEAERLFNRVAIFREACK